VKWATSKVVHFDRVISAWLIARFIDTDAEFEFVDGLPKDGDDRMTFGMAGASFGGHDTAGTGFSKILDHYKLVDPALEQLRLIVDQTVRFALDDGIALSGTVQNALLGIAEGIMLDSPDDARCLERSFPIYDALYRGLSERFACAAERPDESVLAATYRVTGAARAIRSSDCGRKASIDGPVFRQAPE
jgi:hypothetical protein